MAFRRSPVRSRSGPPTSQLRGNAGVTLNHAVSFYVFLSPDPMNWERVLVILPRSWRHSEDSNKAIQHACDPMVVLRRE